MRFFFLFLCYLLLYSCNEDLNNNNFKNILSSHYSGNISCVDNISNIKHYDYLYNYMNEIKCEYNDNKIIENHYGINNANIDSLSLRKEISWKEDEIEVIILDYIQGDPDAQIPFLIEYFKIKLK